MTISNIKVPQKNHSIACDPSNDYLSILVGSDCKFNSGATGVITGTMFNISYY